MQDAFRRMVERKGGLRNQHRLQAFLLILPLSTFIFLAWHHRWIVDDGYIFLRVVDMLASGHGPVFNAGERVEAFSSPLWLALLTLADLTVPLRLEWIAVGLGIVLATAGLALAMAGSARLLRIYQPHAWLLPFGALVPICMFAVWRFATSGMETGLVAAWLGACLLVLARWAHTQQRMPAGALVLIGLGWLVRPEMALFSGLFVTAVLCMQWRLQGWKGRLGVLVAAGALPVAYQVFRMGYYGAVLANPAIAKDASQMHWPAGWAYLLDFTGPYWLGPALLIVMLGGYLPLVLGLWRHQATRALVVTGVFVTGGLCHALYIIGVGGDWLHARLLLPTLYALVFPVTLTAFTRSHAFATALIPWALACALVLRPEQYHNAPRLADRIVMPLHRHVLIEERGWGRAGHHPRRLREDNLLSVDAGLGLRFEAITIEQPGPYLNPPAISARALGLSSFALGPEWQVIDVFGLAHAITARFAVTPSLTFLPRKAGHKKPLPTVWLAALTTASGSVVNPLEFPGTPNPLIPDTHGEEFQQQIEWAREVLMCGAVAELMHAVTEPLDRRRFAANFTGAWARTRLTIPPDPQQAWHKFCG